MRGLSILTLAVAFVAVGCTRPVRRGDWTVGFESAADGDDTTRVHLGIHASEHCEGDPLWSTTLEHGETGGDVPALPTGSYSISAWAFDADCNVVSSVCTGIDLAASPNVSVLFRTVTRAPCMGAVCDFCERADASVPLDAGPPEDGGSAHGLDASESDASMDGGVPADAPRLDAGPRDGGPDAPTDVRIDVRPACTTTEGLCRNSYDDDCDGLTDCDDDECASRVICDPTCGGSPC